VASGDVRPDRDLEGVRRAHARLLETVKGIDDTITARPSLLPGWDVAMLVTHLARNADSHAHMAEGARAGERRRRYASPEARDAGIDEGRGRAARVVIDDLRAAIHRLESTWASLPAEAWAGAGVAADGEPEPIAESPRSRWREVEIHHADLGLGFTVDDWDEDFVGVELDRWMPGLGRRLPPGAGAEVVATDTGRSWTSGAPTVTMRVEAPSRRILAWLIGRGTDDVPEIGPWGW
jgi:maleylpyruvate isomerase